MVTAVDANVLFDMLSGPPDMAEAGFQAIFSANRSGVVVISVVTYAELATNKQNAAVLDAFLARFSIAVEPLDKETAALAATFQRAYRTRGGTRSRILADFLIAAHATLRADRLLTRDARFFNDSIPDLVAVHPQDV